MRLGLLAVLLVPSTGHAAEVIAAIGVVLSTVVVYGITVGQILLTVGLTAYGASKKRRMQRAARNERNASLEDRMVSGIATDWPLRYVYGRPKVPAYVVDVLTSGGRDEYSHLVCELAAHECDGIEEIWVGGRSLGPLDAEGNVTGGHYLAETTEYGSDAFTAYPGSTFTIPVGGVIENSIACSTNDGENGDISVAFTYNPATRVVSISGTTFVSMGVIVRWLYTVGHPRVRVKIHLGTPADPADASLLAECPGQWTSADVLRDHTYIVVRIDKNQQEFQAGPPRVEALTRGKKVFDFRTSATAWSDNPALCMADYLCSEFYGASLEDLPLSQWITAANVCDEPTWFGKRYTMHGPVSSDDEPTSVLDQMALAMAGDIEETTFGVYAGAWTAPVMELTQADIVGSVAVIGGVPGSELYNGVRGKYVSVETQYVPDDFVPYQNPTYRAADGEDLYNDIEFLFTNSQQRVHNICRILVEDQRNGQVVRAEFSLKAWKLKRGDRVTTNFEKLGVPVGKVFRVDDRTYGADSPVELVLKEDTAAIWDFADATVLDATPNSSLPNPFVLDKLASLTCTSGTNELLIAQDGTIISRIRATWPETMLPPSGRIEIEWQRVGAGVWEGTNVRGDVTEAFCSPVEDGVFYALRARGVTPYAKGDWTYSANHMVIGKTEPPSNYDEFTIKFQPDGTRQFEFLYTTTVPPGDLAGPVIRYKQGSDPTPDWDTMLPLNSLDPPYPANPYETNLMLAGPHVFALRAIDRTKNLSATPLYIQATLPDRRLGNVLDEFYEHTEGWLGTKTACHVVDGILEANNSDTWATHTTWSSWMRWNSAPASPITYETPVRDIGTVVAGGINSNITALGTWAVQMRSSVDNVSWTAYGDAGGLFTGRYVQFRAIVTATAQDPIPQISQWIIQVQADVIKEYVNDLVISSLTGVHRIGVGDIRVPLANTYNVIKRASATVQDSSNVAWTLALIDKSPSGPRFQFRANGVLSDPAKVDVYIEGS